MAPESGVEPALAAAADAPPVAEEVISLGTLDEMEAPIAAEPEAPRIVSEELAPVAPPEAPAALPVAAAPAPAPETAIVAAPAAMALPLPVRSLEDTVAELLKPMLREWLDSNMPRIIAKALTPEELAKSLKRG